MDFKDSIKRLTERIESLKANLQTEEATKTALIMPFISALGYDVFNPLEVLPEMCCDIGTKKGEKIDYAILKDGEPIILVECKHWQQNLTLHDNQLLRYFHVSKAKFGVLTNGIIYRFYTDLAEPNKMDEKPFLEVNLLDIKEEQIEELKKFHKSYYDVEEILSTASELKYMGELRTVIEKEFTSPSPDLVKFLGKQVYEGVFTPKVLEQFTALLKRTIQNYINTTISDRLKAAINDHETIKVETPNVEVTEPVVEDIPANKIVTTEEEIEAFYIIKAILRDTIATERVTYRDAQSYFAIFIDNNNRKPVCRLYLNSETNKKITFVGEDKKEQHNKINSLDEIYQYSDQLIEAAKRFV
ncbi:MAG: type I restriction enzyme HsdR N-terminal domain-containing protein [Bacteroidaceae bacterium]|mgnify:CR=1 FL=1|nr:type I restriction enzyme HsdR N-terminal domain-containing protein [Bacteroidaceae bacterium]